jgi:hypothetical protein
MLAVETSRSMGILSFMTGSKWDCERRWPLADAEQSDPEDGGSMFRQSVSICVQTAWCHSLENCNMDNDYLENLKA